MAKISTQIPSVNGINVHNDLIGLNDGDYQHLTQIEKNNLEYITNKQNSLDPDLTNSKYPTVTAVINGNTDVLNSANNYTDSKIVNVYTYKGNVANYASLPTIGLTIGDVYNALDTDINWAWTGTVWDNLGGTVDVSEKLDRGGYMGTAQNLKDDIDNIYQPNVLISAVPPSRSLNTFTYSANQYQVLINKTIRTNPATFVTTIDVAATNYKRVDLIYFKSDNTIAKIIGVESLTVAVRPDVPADSVGISFINVFGNIVEAPTPITEEISIQDYNGTEQFRITDYLRFKGVSFDTGAKALITDPLVPLSAFLDPINGNDLTASVENANKPFKTMSTLINTLPATTGETYTIYLTGGNIEITRLMPNRNLKFIAYMNTNLDFTNVKLDDGVTDATYVFRNELGCTYTFENGNISIINNYVGVKGFCSPSTEYAPQLKGSILNFNWKSTGAFIGRASVISSGTDIYIQNLYDSPQDTYIFHTSSGAGKVTIGIFFTQYKRNLFTGRVSDYDIKNIIQVGFNNSPLYLFGINGKIGNVTMDGILYPSASGSLEVTGTISDGCSIDFVSVPLVTGNIKSNNYHTNQYVFGYTIFRNFTGKLSNLYIAGGQLEFQNCDINVSDRLVFKSAESGRDDICIFKGSNTIYQDTANQPLFVAQDATAIIEIQDFGTTKTNVSYFGNKVRYIYKASTFKEKLNEVVIRNKIDLINRQLSSNTTYVIDANLLLLTGEYIQVPVGGLTLAGYGFDVSSISKNVLGQSIFISPSGNSGNFVTRDIMYAPGLGSVFNLIDSDGSHAIEFNDVNFQGVTGSSLGTFTGYRQFTGTTCGFYGLSDGLTLEGNWSGFKLTNSNVIGFGSTGTLFKKGTSTLFSNRFYIDLNLQIATGSKICDFSEANFSNKKSLQIVNCYVKIGSDVLDNTTVPNITTVTALIFPNISPYSPKSYFLNNIGIKNTTEVISDKLLLTFDGIQNIFNIPHELGIVPKSFQLTFSDGSNTDFIESVRSIDSTKITITCTNIPAAGSIIVYYSVST